MESIVFDIDDILWPLNKRVAKITGIDYSKLQTFFVKNNTLLSDYEKDLVFKAYFDPNIFKDIEWYHGAEKIMELEKYGVNVYINSNCGNHDIAKLKYDQIHKLIDIPDKQLILNILDASGKDKKKEIGDNVWAFIDDSPHNLLSAKAKYLYTLNTLWNTNVPELDKLNIKRFDTLEEIIDDLIKELSMEQEYKEGLYDDIELD